LRAGRSFKTKLKIDHCTPKTFLFYHRKYSGQSIFEGCMNLPNFLLSSYGGVALFIFIFLNWRKITMNKNKIEIKRRIAQLDGVGE